MTNNMQTRRSKNTSRLADRRNPSNGAGVEH
jgi:hypothetical protein